MSKKLKPRDKITQKMSRDGLIEVNETAGHRRAGQRARAGRGFFQAARTGGAGSRAAASAPIRQCGSSSPYPGAFSEAGRRRSRACFGAYRRCPYPHSVQKGDKAGAAGSGGKNKNLTPAIHRGRTGDAGASKGDLQIGKSRRPLGRSAGGYSEEESLDKRAHL